MGDVAWAARKQLEMTRITLWDVETMLASTSDDSRGGDSFASCTGFAAAMCDLLANIYLCNYIP
jgi:hypothetical protein